MRKLYTSPKLEKIEFDTKDVITMSGLQVGDDILNGEAANDDEFGRWTNLY